MAFLDETRQLIPKLFQDLSFRPHFWGTGFRVWGLGLSLKVEGKGEWRDMLLPNWRVLGIPGDLQSLRVRNLVNFGGDDFHK
jgi:hypothetical protein